MEEFRQIMHETVISPLFTLFTARKPQVFHDFGRKPRKHARRACVTVRRALCAATFCLMLASAAAAETLDLAADSGLTAVGVAERMLKPDARVDVTMT
jgi:hypothetical protein